MKNNTSTVLIKEIAEKAGLSPSTVSLVLNGRGDEMRISRNTQELVKEIAKEMDYHPNIYARRLRNSPGTKNRLLIGIFWNRKLLDDMANFFAGAYDTSHEHDYGTELVVRIYDEDHLKDHQDILNSQNYNGIVVNGASGADVEFLEKNRPDIPVVLTTGNTKTLNSVQVDNYQVGRICARLFAENGYVKAGIVSDAKPSTGSILRIVGFRDGLREYGLELRPEWQITGDEFRTSVNYQITRELFSQPEHPDCLFVQRSMMDLGIHAALRDAGLKVPEDVVILSCGLVPFLAGTEPSFSMVGGSMSAFGRASLDLLMLLINNNITAAMNTITPPVFQFNESFDPELKNNL